MEESMAQGEMPAVGDEVIVVVDGRERVGRIVTEPREVDGYLEVDVEVRVPR
jgi:hypothetical protein